MQNEAVVPTPQSEGKQFKMTNRLFKKSPRFFSESNAPTWLTSENTVLGSTMDNRWFWQKHVLTLKVGESVNTDFQVITRTA